MKKNCTIAGISPFLTIQQVAGAIGISVMVSLLSAKQNTYLSTVSNDMTEATASGSSFVLTIGLVLAIINLVLSLFIVDS
ncbi:hypothetical protein [Fontibacillus panacisegetis]|uniref:hypothetical protein n=1 Tax=Fontibacillus panacisegetis TaxID=670482 RepID=UPI001587D763|nr:hypothetical protein [Fontibacillus panacisegetis]